MVLAHAPVRAYLNDNRLAASGIIDAAAVVHEAGPMLHPAPAPDDVIAARPSGVAAAIVGVAAVLGVVCAAGAGALWMHYGTAVFFEMIKSGIAACI